MVIEDSFEVGAAPDATFAYLLDVEKVVTCMPGAELLEAVDEKTFKARMKIKVGPIVTKYDGTAEIVARDDASRTATLAAEGKESVGAGSARASIAMSVEPTPDGSLVRITTDYSVAGRVAQFGRGVMEDVSRHLTAQMAECIRQRLAVAEAGEFSTVAQGEPGPAATATAAPAAEPLSGLRLLVQVLRGRLRRLFGR